MAALAFGGRDSTPANMSTFTSETRTPPPMMATRPSVCSVVFINRRVAAGRG